MSADGVEPIRAKIKKVVPEYSFQPADSIHSVGEALAPDHFEAVAGHD